MVGSYAVFLFERPNGTSKFSWREHAAYDANAIKKLASRKYKDFDQLASHYFLQFHLDKHLKEVHEYALEQGVALKGDIPIGVSPDSVEVWTEPELFNIHAQAGAPPDDFAVSGQNWSFPTYNWDKMEKISTDGGEGVFSNWKSILMLIGLIIFWDFSAYGKYLKRCVGIKRSV